MKDSVNSFEWNPLKEHNYCQPSNITVESCHLDSSYENKPELIISNLHDEIRKLTDKLDEFSKYRDQVLELNKSVKRLEARVSESDKEISGHKLQIQILKTQERKLKTKLSKDFTSIENMLSDECGEKPVHFYTGFKTQEKFIKFYKLVKPQFSLKNPKALKNGITRLTYKKELFMVLMRLRLGLLEEDISYRYNISQASISRSSRTWCQFFTQDLIKINEPPITTPRISIILDSNQIFYEKPFKIKSEIYKNNKKPITKGFLAVTENGYIHFVSSLCPGRTTDVNMFLDSGILDTLQAGDVVIADSAYSKIEKELTNLGVTLEISDGSLSSFNRKRYLLIEKIRRSIKTFRILKFIFSNAACHENVSLIWQSCGYLHNFLNEDWFTQSQTEEIEDPLEDPLEDPVEISTEIEEMEVDL